MQQVGDQFGVFGVRQGGADHARLAVVQAAHGVEQMRKAHGAMFQRGHAVFIGTERVADLYAHAGVGQGTHQVQVAGDFRRHGDDAQLGQRLQAFDFGQRGSARVVGLRPELAGIDVRAFQVGAQHACRVRAAVVGGDADGAQCHVDIFRRRRHGGGQQAGGAVARMDGGDGVDGFAAFHDVLAGAAMHMQVDEAGQDVIIAIARRVEGIARDAVDALAEGDGAVDPAAGGKDIAFDSAAHLRDSATNS